MTQDTTYFHAALRMLHGSKQFTQLTQQERHAVLARAQQIKQEAQRVTRTLSHSSHSHQR